MISRSLPICLSLGMLASGLVTSCAKGLDDLREDASSGSAAGGEGGAGDDTGAPASSGSGEGGRATGGGGSGHVSSSSSSAGGAVGAGGSPCGATPCAAAARIACGAFHACALTASNGVKCWGYNNEGELGNGSTADSATPVDVQGLATPVTALATGEFHSCALTSSGGIRCWGYNSEGQLGDGSLTDSHVPVDVQGIASGVAMVSATAHTCALKQTGDLQCWGWNYYGQLGDNSKNNSLVPIDIALATPVLAVTAGAAHTCVLKSVDGIQCWGWNTFGQLGTGSNADSQVPVDVMGGAFMATALSAFGNFSCALTSGGGVKCWGLNDHGELGNGSMVDSLVPVDVQGLSASAISIAAGLDHTCALLTSGGVQCWGGNGAGQLGNASTSASAVPVDVQGVAGAVQIAAGQFFTCALLDTSKLMCWGSNDHGQLGNGSLQGSLVPTDVVWP